MVICNLSLRLSHTADVGTDCEGADKKMLWICSCKPLKLDLSLALLCNSQPDLGFEIFFFFLIRIPTDPAESCRIVQVQF